MSHGAGHILDAINRMKQNRKLLPSNRTKFKENNRDMIYSSIADKKSNQINFKTISEYKLNEIKKRIREHAKAERKKEHILFAIFFVCGLIALILILMT